MKRFAVTGAALTVFAASLAIGTPARVGAQAPAAGASTTFEVASVKPNKSGDQRVMLAMPPTGRFSATNVPLRVLLQQAYQFQPFQIVGAPNWVVSERFDIVAKAPEGAVAPEQLRPMLRALLADRFKLVAHIETREMPVYHLVLARPDGKLGPSLKESKTDCEAVFRGRRGGGPPPPFQPGQPMECGFMTGMGTMNAGGMPLTELARTISTQVSRVVSDKTGLTGRYSFQLTYAPEGGNNLLGLPAGPPPPGVTPADPNAPTLFTALQEQLGLKLDSQRGPVEVLVIDHVEQPTED